MPRSDEAQPGHPNTARGQAWGAGGEPRARAGCAGRAACQEAASFSLQAFYSPASTKAAAAVGCSHDQTVVGFFLHLCVT